MSFIAPATAPHSVVVTETHANNLTLNWSNPTTPYGIIISYTIRYNLSEGNLTSLTTQAPLVTLVGLNEYTVYEIGISAATRVGYGPYVTAHVTTGQASKTSSYLLILILTNRQNINFPLHIIYFICLRATFCSYKH